MLDPRNLDSQKPMRLKIEEDSFQVDKKHRARQRHDKKQIPENGPRFHDVGSPELYRE
jgi:hypothetical protein